tara:strand:- start:113 stop:1036 length:924 start_codon:yes stop_codon:yes gene_type:complete
MANAWGELTWGINNWGLQSDVTVPVSNPNDEPYGTYAYGENDFGGSAGNLGISTGSVTITAEINAGWGRELGWGTLDWGANTLSVQAITSGQQLNTNLGTAVSAIETFASVIGNGLTVEEGILDPRPDVILEGQQLNTNLGQPIISADANLSVTGIGLTIDEGNATLDANTIPTIIGLQLNIAEGNTLVGAVANVPVTGLGLTVDEGILDPMPDVILPSVQVNVGLGNETITADANVTPTGLGLDVGIGTATFVISGNVELTGNQLNIAIGNYNVQVWTEVDTGTSVAYTEVSTGTSVSWNEVDTAA